MHCKLIWSPKLHWNGAWEEAKDSPCAFKNENFLCKSKTTKGSQKHLALINSASFLVWEITPGKKNAQWQLKTVKTNVVESR